MAKLPRREREKVELRSKILSAARDLFAAQGYEAVTMRKIADAIEYSATAIYAYFRDKEALFHELCRDDFAALAKVFVRRSDISDPIERIRRTGQAYVEFAIRHPNHYRLMFMTRDHNQKTLTDDMLKTRGNPDEDAYAYLRGLVSEAMDAGLFRAEVQNVELITQTLWAAVHGVASLQIVKGDDPWVEWRPLRERTCLMLDAVLRGLIKPRSSR